MQHTTGLTQTEHQLATLADGLEKNLPPDKEVLVGGESLKAADLAKRVRERLALYRDARLARLAANQKAHDRDEQHPATRKLLRQVRTGLDGMFGDESPELENFGFRPKAPRAQPSYDERVARHDKLVATRERNHTLGKRQKEALADGETAPATPPTPPPRTP
jgi:hypothetical protein